MKLHDLDDDAIGLLLSAVSDGNDGEECQRPLAARTEAAYALARCSKQMRDAVYKWALPLARQMRTHLGTKFVLHAAGSPEERPLFYACREAHVLRSRSKLSLSFLQAGGLWPNLFMQPDRPPWATDRKCTWREPALAALTLVIHRTSASSRTERLHTHRLSTSMASTQCPASPRRFWTAARFRG